MQRIIGFISDFGLDDTWVGVCRAVIARACPQAYVVDLGHSIPPFDVRKGAATAVAAVHQLPGSILLVVVDPGVGPDRRDLCLITQRGSVLVGPDNGVLIPAALRGGGIHTAIAIDPSKIDFQVPLASFHARDVLAPAAAAVACGVDPRSLGEAVAPESLRPAPFPPCSVENKTMLAEVLESDRFGSLRFNVAAEDMERAGLNGPGIEFDIGHSALVATLGVSFSSVPEGELVAFVDSSGWLTLAINRGSVQERFGIASATPARIRNRD
jgi:S-adenosylmethionine hydrolase